VTTGHGRIVVSGVGKRFTKYEDTPTLAYGLLHAWSRTRRSQLWALQDVNFDIEPGEAVGIIGRNGSGKSTLLQLLSGVTAPTTGEVRVSGRIAPLLSVGVGFHPELTGRENIFVNGAILGMRRAEVAARIEQIIDFAEVRDFIDTPVKFYSSGMFVRLGFAVAAHVDPDVLLIDEVLAVGDFAFQRRCFEYMAKLRSGGTTVILVSHNATAVEQFCDRGIVLRAGRKAFDGPVHDAISAYHRSLGAVDTPRERGELPFDADVAETTAAELVGPDGRATARFTTGETATLRVRLRARDPVRHPFLSIEVLSEDGVMLYREHNLFTPYPAIGAGEEATLEVAFPVRLTTGTFTVTYVVGRGNPTSESQLDLGKGAAQLVPQGRLPMFVSGRQGTHGIVDLTATFAGGGS
jgi:lipopolysaccharide transport system ATP-binding protein